MKRARAAVERLKDFDKYRDAEDAWSDFLLAANGIYTKLEQGAKGCNTSYAWFGGKRAERKADDLLQFLHHARNADEHGVGGTTLARANFEVLEGKIHDIGVNMGPDREPDFLIKGEIGARVGVTKFQTVKAVIDRGVTFMPPKVHLGQSLPDEPTTYDLASAALPYLEGVIAEAEALPQH